MLLLYVNCSVKRLKFALKWSISYFQPVFAAIFVTIASVKVKLISDLYTWVIVLIVQALISVQALVFDLAQLTGQKRFDCRNAILGSSAILLDTSYS